MEALSLIYKDLSKNLEESTKKSITILKENVLFSFDVMMWNIVNGCTILFCL